MAALHHGDAPPMPSYNFSLSEAVRDQGIDRMGADVHSLIDRLDSGSPVTVGLLGASVALNAGCVSQPGSRCMWYNGVKKAPMSWGRPHYRPFKGWMVRFFEQLNATWPHANHVLHNGGRDGTPISAVLPCLYSVLPPAVNLVVLELGSMSHDLISDFRAHHIEFLVRELASLRPPPTIVFHTIALWCSCKPTCRRTNSFATKLPHRTRSPLRNSQSRGPLSLEADLRQTCTHYNVSCLSMRSALNESVAAQRPGFTFEELTADCLHPIHGTRGVDYTADVLVHWLQRAASTARAVRAVRVAHRGHLQPHRMVGHERSRLATGNGPGRAIVDPRPDARSLQPLFKATLDLERRQRQGAACYFVGPLGRPFDRKVTYMPWQTAHCNVADLSSAPLKALTAGSACKERNVVFDCPASAPPPGWVPPPVWLYCTHALAAGAKPSPGAVGLVPHATAFLEIDVSFAMRAAHAAHTGAAAIDLKLLHLTSYEGMGVARVRCAGACACDLQRIDAHRTSATRNVSVFVEHVIRARAGTDAARRMDESSTCVLVVWVTNETSSGAHKFKIRQLTVVTRID